MSWNGHITMNAEPGNGRATWTLKRVEASTINLVSCGDNAISSVGARGDPAPDGSRINCRQAGLVAAERFISARIAARPKAPALQQSFDSAGDQSRHFHDFGVF